MSDRLRTCDKALQKGRSPPLLLIYLLRFPPRSLPLRGGSGRVTLDGMSASEFLISCSAAMLRFGRSPARSARKQKEQKNQRDFSCSFCLGRPLVDLGCALIGAEAVAMRPPFHVERGYRGIGV